jgi:uncharacterized protein
MTDIRFEWDPAKDSSSQKKHGISFSDAQTVFSDPFARLIADPDHSDEEDRPEQALTQNCLSYATV